MSSSKPLLELELRPIAAPSAATPGACVYVLLPSLEELVGKQGFGRTNSICLPKARRPYDPLAFLAHARQYTETMH